MVSRRSNPVLQLFASLVVVARGAGIWADAPHARREAAAKAPGRSLRLRGPHGVYLCHGAKLPLRQALRGASRSTALRERCLGLRTRRAAILRGRESTPLHPQAQPQLQKQPEMVLARVYGQGRPEPSAPTAGGRPPPAVVARSHQMLGDEANLAPQLPYVNVSVRPRLTRYRLSVSACSGVSSLRSQLPRPLRHASKFRAMRAVFTDSIWSGVSSVALQPE